MVGEREPQVPEKPEMPAPAQPLVKGEVEKREEEKLKAKFPGGQLL